MDCRYVLDAPDAARPLLRRALADLGLCETAPNVVPSVSDGEPWCALELCLWLQEGAGLDVPRIASARELLRYLGEHGYSIPRDGELVAGDVVGWERHDAAGGVIGAHCGLVLASADDGLDVLSGNSGPHARRVWISLVDAARVQWAARVIR